MFKTKNLFWTVPYWRNLSHRCWKYFCSWSIDKLKKLVGMHDDRLHSEFVFKFSIHKDTMIKENMLACVFLLSSRMACNFFSTIHLIYYCYTCCPHVLRNSSEISLFCLLTIFNGFHKFKYKNQGDCYEVFAFPSVHLRGNYLKFKLLNFRVLTDSWKLIKLWATVSVLGRPKKRLKNE